MAAEIHPWMNTPSWTRLKRVMLRFVEWADVRLYCYQGGPTDGFGFAVGVMTTRGRPHNGGYIATKYLGPSLTEAEAYFEDCERLLLRDQDAAPDMLWDLPNRLLQ